jgi:hypothetical protein
MAITITQTAQLIQFKLWGEKAAELKSWQEEINKKIYLEQTSTGCYKGKLPVSELVLKIMTKIYEEKGIYRPYYGADSASGLLFGFHPFEKSCKMKAINTLSEDVFEVQEAVSEDSNQEPGNANRLFNIQGLELENLFAWENWVSEHFFKGRYIFSFGKVSMGNGSVINVLDLVTDTKIDITDYDSW